MPAGRRRFVTGHPGIQRDQHGPQNRAAIVQNVARLLAETGRGRSAAEMLRPGDEIHPHLRRQGQIPFSRHVGVQQGSAAAPVFRGGLGENQFRYRTRRAHAGQRIPLFAGFRIGLGGGREREEFRAGPVAFVVGPVFRGHAKPVIERALARAGYMQQRAVEHRTFSFVGVETFVEKVVNQPARLRNPEDVSGFNRVRERIGRAGPIRGGVTEERHAIPQRRQSQPGDPRLFGCVHQIIKPAGPQTGLYIQVPGIGNQAVILPTTKRPVGRWHGLRRCGAAGTHRECGLVGIEGNGGKSVRNAPGTPRERAAENLLRTGDFQMHPAGDGLAVFPRDGQSDQQPLLSVIHHFAVPTASQDRIPLPHEKSIARMRPGARIVGQIAAVEGPQREHVAAIVHVVQDAPVSPGRRHRFEQEKICPALDATPRVARRER